MTSVLDGIFNRFRASADNSLEFSKYQSTVCVSNTALIV